MSLQTLKDLPEKYRLCLTFPQNQLNPVCNKVMRKEITFISKFFSSRLFYMLYFKIARYVICRWMARQF